MQTQIKQQQNENRANVQTIRDASLTYEQRAEELNISELASIPIDLQIYDKTKEKINQKTGLKETYVIKVFEIGGKQYRMPLTVLRDLKAMLSKNSNIKMFSVIKEGEGKENTRYTVMPSL